MTRRSRTKGSAADLINYQGQVAAISRSLAVIEFALDGTIVDANANFLSVIGYTREELIGKQHRMLVRPSDAAAPEYAQFWARLAAGQAQTGEFLRVGKGGKHVWIQASYNPILDAAGKVFKIVKYAIDTTAQHVRNLDYEGQIAAISRSMAVIEFGLDGTILSANDNFLAAMGYAREEIVGRHHRMFVRPEHAASAEYAQFWADLNAGKFKAAEFLRVGKAGNDVWIQASYNPIFDFDGKPYKVIKYATDITAQKLAARDDAGRRRLLADTLRIRSALDGATTSVLIADENFNIVYVNEAALKVFRAHEASIQRDLPGFSVDKLIGSSIDIFHKNPQRQRQLLSKLHGHHRVQFKLGDRIFKTIAGVARDASGNVAGFTSEWLDVTEELAAQTEVERVLTAAADGDLTLRIESEQFTGFLRFLGEHMNRLIDSVSGALSSAKTAIEQVSQASAQLRSTSQMMSSSAVQLNQAADRSSGALAKVAEGVKANADNASMANQLVTQTSTAAKSGQTRMEEMTAAMGIINTSAQQIAKIIKVIDEIAFQTNLLALNAAVEAARAGRHGKGFAVVAQEVRSLAERSAKAAKETAELIEDSVAKVDQGVAIANATREALKEIVANVLKVVDLAADIAAASNEQSTGVTAVSDSMREVTIGSQAGSQQSNEVAAAAEEMGRQMAVLKDRLDKYRVKQPAPDGATLAGVPQVILDQVLAVLRASGLALPANLDGGKSEPQRADNGRAAASGADPRLVLPLDRDERGFAGF